MAEAFNFRQQVLMLYDE
jgi:serine/threonine-protein phosphatase 2B catalytic subunit